MKTADLLTAKAALQGKLPPGYQLERYDSPWFVITKQWHRKPIEGDVLCELAGALKGYEVREGPAYTVVGEASSAGIISWLVQPQESASR